MLIQDGKTLNLWGAPGTTAPTGSAELSARLEAGTNLLKANRMGVGSISHLKPEKSATIHKFTQTNNSRKEQILHACGYSATCYAS
jgi:hypothetical protein